MLLAMMMVPILILMEVLKERGVMARFYRYVAPWTRPLDLPPEAAPALGTGVAFGLMFGAGVVLQTGREGKLDRRQLTTLCLFLSICHAVVEETIIFVAIGANGLVILASRFFFGILAAWTYARLSRWWGSYGAEGRI